MLIGREIAMPLNSTVHNGERTWNSAKYPMTRMGMAAQLRQAFIDAQDYEKARRSQQKEAAGDAKATPPKRDRKLEALLPYRAARSWW